MPEIPVLQIPFSFSCVWRNKTFPWRFLWSLLRLEKYTLHTRTYINIFLLLISVLYLSLQSGKRTRSQRVWSWMPSNRMEKAKRQTGWHLRVAALCLQTPLTCPETMSMSWNQVKFQAFILCFDKFFPPYEWPDLCRGIMLSFHSWGTTSSVFSTESSANAEKRSPLQWLLRHQLSAQSI